MPSSGLSPFPSLPMYIPERCLMCLFHSRVRIALLSYFSSAIYDLQNYVTVLYVFPALCARHCLPFPSSAYGDTFRKFTKKNSQSPEADDGACGKYCNKIFAIYRGQVF